jgi:cell division protein FtsZ
MKKSNSMEVKPKIESFARIKVLGIGGSGTNAVNRMTELGIKGVEFIAVNTDAQALHNNKSDKKVHIGRTITKGLGSGMNPELGRQAAEESIEDLEEVISSSDMVFITCGLGGGTGTGAAPIVAELAKNKGILTVAVVTKPFTFEGSKRKEVAEVGYDNLKDKVDAIISIHNDRILQIIDKKTSLVEAFKTVDEVLRQGIAGISDLITTHGIVNADFADVRSIMQDAGTALMGIGRASGENRAQEAARQAINSPLLELAIDGAKGVLFNITGGSSLGMFEIDEAAKVITKSIDPDAKVKFGTVIDDSMGEEIRITVIATGFDESSRRPIAILSQEEKRSLIPEQKTAPVNLPPITPVEVRKPLFNPKPQPPRRRSSLQLRKRQQPRHHSLLPRRPPLLRQQQQPQPPHPQPQHLPARPRQLQQPRPRKLLSLRHPLHSHPRRPLPQPCHL